MKISLRPVLVGLILLVAIVGLTRVVPNAAPGASPTTAHGKGTNATWCDETHQGVSLVIDYGATSKRAAEVRCAEGFNLPGLSKSTYQNGWQLFDAAGIAVVGTTDYPVGFVCRVEGYPLVKDQPCTKTPSYAQGHWAYFYAPADSGNAPNWRFSGTGASMRQPECGSAEAWLFVVGSETDGTQSATAPRLKPKVFKCQP